MNKLEEQYKLEPIQEQAKELGETIEKICPENDERSQAFIKLSELVFWVTASIVKEDE